MKKIFLWSLSDNRSWENRVRSLMDSIGLNELLDNRTVSRKCAVQTVKAKLISDDSVKWKDALWDDSNQENGNKLRTYRLYKTDLITEDYVNISMDRSHRRILARFRSGSLPLFIETGRYAKPKVPLNERKCKFCSAEMVEDELHFLLGCDFYSDLRRPLLDKAKLCNTDFQVLSHKDQFIFIMNHINLQRCLASTLCQMFKRRKVFI